MDTETPKPLAAEGRLPNVWDLIAILCVFATLISVAHVARGTWVRIDTPGATEISLDPWRLPEYAVHTTLRMFAALAASLVFTFTFGTAAAKSRRAGVVLIPLLDILQSVPILGFLTFTVVFFMNLFPGQVLGLELASIFAIFTSQAWNMAFSMYQSLRTVPADLLEASTSFRLSAWQKFWRLEVPFAIPGLVWNTMMSMSGGWFFVVASEAISVGDTTWKLPGIGSYIAQAQAERDIGAIAWAILTMLVVILAYDQLLFRPLVAWSGKFRFETTAGATASDPWMLRLIRRTRLLSFLGDLVGQAASYLVGCGSRSAVRRGHAVPPVPGDRYRLGDRVGWSDRLDRLASLHFRRRRIDLAGPRRGSPARSGDFAARGRADDPRQPYLGADRRLARPAPGMGETSPTRGAISRGVSGEPVLSGVRRRDRALSIEQGHLAYAADGVGNPVVYFVQCHRRSRRVSGGSARGRRQLPGQRLAVVAQGDHSRDLLVYITGAITASGGCWNAAIVAEVVSWGDTKLVAHGLGAYIAEATERGDMARVVLGVAVMSGFVLAFNRLLWHPLYWYARRRLTLG